MQLMQKLKRLVVQNLDLNLNLYGKRSKLISGSVNNLVGVVKANPRDFYRYINSQKKDTQGIPPLKKRNGSGIAQSEFEKAEEFNGQFSDVFTKSEYKQVPLMDRSAPFMHDIVVTKEGVTKLLKGLNPTEARVLKELAVE